MELFDLFGNRACASCKAQVVNLRPELSDNTPHISLGNSLIAMGDHVFLSWLRIPNTGAAASSQNIGLFYQFLRINVFDDALTLLDQPQKLSATNYSPLNNRIHIFGTALNLYSRDFVVAWEGRQNDRWIASWKRFQWSQPVATPYYPAVWGPVITDGTGAEASAIANEAYESPISLTSASLRPSIALIDGAGYSYQVTTYLEDEHLKITSSNVDQVLCSIEAPSGYMYIDIKVEALPNNFVTNGYAVVSTLQRRSTGNYHVMLTVFQNDSASFCHTIYSSEALVMTGFLEQTRTKLAILDRNIILVSWQAYNPSTSTLTTRGVWWKPSNIQLLVQAASVDLFSFSYNLFSNATSEEYSALDYALFPLWFPPGMYHLCGNTILLILLLCTY